MTSENELLQEIKRLRQRVAELETQTNNYPSPDFNILCDAIPDAVAYTDPDRVIRYVNPAMQRVLGYAPDELIGQTICILYASLQDCQEQGRLRYHAEAPPNREPYEVAYRHKNGEVFIAEAHGTLVQDDSGRHIGNVVIIRDISERKAIEEALRISESRLAEAQRIAHIGHWVWNIVTNDLAWSDEIYRIFGQQPQEFGATYEAFLGYVHPEDRHLVQDAVNDALHHHTVYSIDHRIVLPSGEIRTVHEQAEVKFDVAGKPISMIGTVQDITARKSVEQELQHMTTLLWTSREVLQRLIKQLPVGIQVFDVNGVCADINQTQLEIFGVPDDSPIVGIYNIFADPLAEQMGTAQAARRALAGETVELGDLTFDFTFADPRFARTNGKRVINVTIFPVLDEEQQVISFVGLNVDVTDRYEAEARRLELAVKTERVRLLEELIGDISHDFKTPVSVIAANLYLIRRHAPSDIYKYLDRSELHLQRLSQLIDDLLTMSHLSQGIQLTLVPTHLRMVMEVVVQLKESLVAEKGQTLRVELSPHLPMVLADSQKLSHVFNNLLDNAINYTPKGGSIGIRGWADNEHVVIEVSDTGIGIEPYDRERIFERFYRADRARASHDGGTGLGLAIVKKIVEMHHGQIEVDSIPAQGSTFRVILPRSEK